MSKEAKTYYLMDGRAAHDMDKAIVLETCMDWGEVISDIDGYGADTCVVDEDYTKVIWCLLWGPVPGIEPGTKPDYSHVRIVKQKERKRAGNIYCDHCKPKKVDAIWRIVGGASHQRGDFACIAHKDLIKAHHDPPSTEADYQTWDNEKF